MKITFSKKLESIDSGIFNILDDKKNELIERNKKIFNLSVGTPDFQPDEHVINALIESAKNPLDWKYSLGDIGDLTEAIIEYYKVRFNVNLNKEEVTSVNGSQEGLSHIGLTLCNEGDKVLVPNPGYPIFEVGPYLCGANIIYYDLLSENHYLPDLNKLSSMDLKDVKFMVFSYPMNPLCATAPSEFYDEIIDFANKNNIILIHDNAYSDIIYDGNEAQSLLAHKGGKDVGVEFYSLSKSFNMTGARISFLLGNKDIIKNFKKLKSQIDYGIFIPIQRAAIAALTGSLDNVKKHCKEYEQRRNILCQGLREIGLDAPNSKGSMFVWAKIPSTYKSSFDFSMDLLDKTGVLCTPGNSFGTLGEGYVRFALVLPEDEIKEAVNAMKRFL